MPGTPGPRTNLSTVLTTDPATQHRVTINAIRDWLEANAAKLTGSDVITIFRAAITDPAFAVALTGDTVAKWRVRADGKQEWGPGGTTATDTTLYRGSAAVLKTDGSLRAVIDLRARDGAAAQSAIGGVGPASEAGLLLGSTGDTNLYRSAPNQLKTDDALEITGALTQGGVGVIAGTRGHVDVTVGTGAAATGTITHGLGVAPSEMLLTAQFASSLNTCAVNLDGDPGATTAAFQVTRVGGDGVFHGGTVRVRWMALR